MRKLMPNLGAAQGAWTDAALTLPALDPAADVATQRWCAVAGGLALVLSRVSPTERAARFARTHVLYEGLRRGLRQGAAVVVEIELLSDVMHEIAEVADPLTRGCLKACFQASLRRPPAAPEGHVALADVRASRLLPSSLQLASRSSRPSSASGDQANTNFSPDTLLQRSAELRRTLATARGGA